MSEILARHRHIVERLPQHNILCFDRVFWPCDGHECPSYIRWFRHRTENLTHLQHALEVGVTTGVGDSKQRLCHRPEQHILPQHNWHKRNFRYK